MATTTEETVLLNRYANPALESVALDNFFYFLRRPLRFLSQGSKGMVTSLVSFLDEMVPGAISQAVVAKYTVEEMRLSFPN